MNKTLIESAGARERAYRQLRVLLTTSALPPKTRLGEIEWAERLDVHRGAVREALAILFHEGLLSREGRSFVVPALSEHDVQEIYRVREILESAALDILASRQLDSAALRPMEEVCEAMECLLKSQLYKGFSEADEKFHTSIIELTENKRLLKIYSLAPLPHAKFGGLPPSNIDQILRKAQHEHVEIYRCLQEGRGGDAIEILREHLKLDATRFEPLQMNKGPHLKSPRRVSIGATQ